MRPVAILALATLSCAPAPQRLPPALEEQHDARHREPSASVAGRAQSQDGAVPTVGFARRYGDFGSDYPVSLARAPEGSFVLATNFSIQTNLGGSTLESRDMGRGSWGIALARLGPRGEHLSSAALDGRDSDVLEAMALARDGDVLLAGRARDLRFGSRRLRTNQFDDLFVARLAPGGELRFASSYGGRGNDSADRVAAAPDGSVWLAGNVNVRASVGGAVMEGDPHSNPFVAHYAANGTPLFSRRLPTRGFAFPTALAVDDGGEVTVAVSFEEALGEGRSRGATDVGLVHLDATGEVQWSLDFGGRETDAVGDLTTVTTGGDVVFTATITGPVVVGGTRVPLRGRRGTLVARLDRAGRCVWARAYPGGVFLRRVAVDRDGGVVVAGGIEEPADWGSGTIHPHDRSDVVVAAFAPDGALRWVATWGGPGQAAAEGLWVGARDEIVVAASFEGTLRLGPYDLRSVSESPDIAVFGLAGSSR